MRTWRLIINPVPKEKCLGGVPFWRKSDLSMLPPGNEMTVCTGSRGWVGVIPEGGYVGPNGCGDCVGVILIPPKSNMKTYVYHIQPDNDPYHCLQKSEFLMYDYFDPGTFSPPTLTWNAPKGYRAVICGSKKILNDEVRDSGRLHVLNEVIRCLECYSIPIEKYVPAPGCAVDKEGKLYWVTPNGLPLGGYEK